MRKEFDPTKPVAYRNGEKAEIVAILDEPLTNGETIVAVLTHSDGDRSVRCHYKNGHFFRDGAASGEDLVNITPTIEVVRWAIIEESGTFVSSWGSEASARIAAGPGERVVRLTGSYEK